MTDIAVEGPSELVDLTAAVVSAYVTKNAMSVSDLPKLIVDVHQAFVGLGAPLEAAPVEDPRPAVSIRKSITPDYLICLEDGKKFKSLKRHLSRLGITPDQYRTKWNLPDSYPMVAPNYSATRSALAKSVGLGRKPAFSAPAPAPKRSRRSSGMTPD